MGSFAARRGASIPRIARFGLYFRPEPDRGERQGTNELFLLLADVKARDEDPLFRMPDLALQEAGLEVRKANVECGESEMNAHEQALVELLRLVQDLDAVVRPRTEAR